MRLLVFTLFAGPGSTKDSLESCFNWLKDSVKMTKSKKMNPFTKFFYAMANPYVKHAGVSQIRPTMKDFQQLLDEGFKDSDVTRHHVFGYNKTPLGKDFPRPNQLIANAKIRKAGFHSNRNAAAASAFMLHDFVHDFSHASDCWPGRVSGVWRAMMKCMMYGYICLLWCTYPETWPSMKVNFIDRLSGPNPRMMTLTSNCQGENNHTRSQAVCSSVERSM